jgi:hypothetical protein
MYLFHASTCFEQQVLIIRRTNLCQYIIWYNSGGWLSDVPANRKLASGGLEYWLNLKGVWRIVSACNVHTILERHSCQIVPLHTHIVRNFPYRSLLDQPVLKIQDFLLKNKTHWHQLRTHSVAATRNELVRTLLDVQSILQPIPKPFPLGRHFRVTHQRVLYQMMYWHKLVLLMMSTCCSKHVEALNKYIEKECDKLVINQN